MTQDQSTPAPTPQDPRLIAYEKLIDALPGLLDQASLARVQDWLESRQILSDGSEDPGAVITEGLDTALAVARTFRDIAAVVGR